MANALSEQQKSLLDEKYTGQDRFPWRRPGERRVTVRVVPDKITGAEWNPPRARDWCLT